MAKRAEQGRFGMRDLAEMLRRMEVINKPLDREESEAMAKADALRVELGPEWKPENSSIAQNCIIVHPMATPAAVKKYKAYYDTVKGNVARMKNVFRFRLGKHTIKDSELREGRLDRRRLGRAHKTDRLFFRQREKQDKGISIGILLDESGSMSIAGPNPPTSDYNATKAQRALQVGILLSEALQGVPGVELEVYSFTTGGPRGDDTYFKYLYGKNNPKKEGLADFGRGRANYDYQAIATAVEQMEKWTTEENKLLVVVSDGAPCGTSRTGMDAQTATKQSVDLARKKGFEVLQIAIEDRMNSNSIYGPKNVIKFSDMTSLINDMRKFVTRLIRKVT